PTSCSPPSPPASRAKRMLVLRRKGATILPLLRRGGGRGVVDPLPFHRSGSTTPRRRPASPSRGAAPPRLRRGGAGSPQSVAGRCRARYCEGVIPVARLNAALNDDFALNPASIPTASTVQLAKAGSARRACASRTR